MAQHHRLYVAYYALVFLLCCHCTTSLGGQSFPLPPRYALRPVIKKPQTEKSLVFSRFSLHAVSKRNRRSESDRDTALVVDEDLYSRQLLVHGKSSQQSLLKSHVAIIGHGPVAWEIAKDLTLAGVGRLSLVCSPPSESHPSDADTDTDTDTDHEHVAFTASIQDLNPYVKVCSYHSLAALDVTACNTVVLTDMSILEAELLNTQLRNKGVKSVFCSVRGVCGVVFADLLDSVHVQDPLQQERQEVILEEGSIVYKNPPSGNPCLQVKCLAEEEVMVEKGDRVTLTLSHKNSSVRLIVLETIDRHTIKLGTNASVTRSSDRVSIFEEVIRSIESAEKTVLIKSDIKLKLCRHESLTQNIESLSHLIPSNSCDDSEKSRVNERLLLRLIKRAENLTITASADGFIDAAVDASFGKHRNSLLHDVKGMWAGILRSRRAERQDEKDNKTPQFTQCPATVSVLGALAAQEVVKACCMSYAPLSQLYTFQSMASIDCPETIPQHASDPDDDLIPTVKGTEHAVAKQNSSIRQLYGPSVMNELSKLRVLVVGVGAIGCEVLKVLQRFNVGQDNNHGGLITITDPDYIERSNLNRQLFFRQRHVGLSKAVVAASYLRNISVSRDGEAFRVTPLTLAVSPDTEHIFSSAFWQNIDVVITALDTTEARQYVDKQCVANGIWMIDAGTVGLKGSTQVVIPFVSESYSTLDNVPEEKEIPVCTMKTFPYKAEHCVAWAKEWFDTLFSADIALLQKVMAAQAHMRDREQVKRSSVTAINEESAEGVSSVLDSDALLEEDVAKRLLGHLLWPHYRPSNPPASSILGDIGLDDGEVNMMQGSLLYALLTFHDLFVQNIATLIDQHPIDSFDESVSDQRQSTLFWGKGRNFPRVMIFDPTSAMHKEFILHTARILCRIRGLDVSRHDLERVYILSIDSLVQQFIETKKKNPLDALSIFLNQDHSQPHAAASIEETPFSAAKHTAHTPPRQQSPQFYITCLREALDTSPQRAAIWRHGQLPDFTNVAATELKAELFLKDSKDHIDFCTAATNIRAASYHIPAVDKLAVLQYAGRIMPAVATTTSLVAGLVGLELTKIATEKATLRKKHLTERTAFSTFASLSSGAAAVPHGKVSWRHKMFSLGGKLKRLISKKWNDHNTNMKKTHQILEQQRILGRFRNFYINLDGPTIAHAEPSAASEVPIILQTGNDTDTTADMLSSFTQWDSIQINGKTVETLSVAYLKKYLLEHFGVSLVSFACADTLLYANFLPAFSSYNNGDDMTISELLKRSNDEIYGKSSKKSQQKKSIDITVYGEDNTEGFEVQLPTIKIPW